MDEIEECLLCEACLCPEGHHHGDDAPEHCECCDDVLCWPCWQERHMTIIT